MEAMRQISPKAFSHLKDCQYICVLASAAHILKDCQYIWEGKKKDREFRKVSKWGTSIKLIINSI